MTYLSDYTHTLLEQLQLKQNTLVKEIVTRYLGQDDWTEDDIVDRAKWIIEGRNKTLFIDGVPLVQFRSPEVEWENCNTRKLSQQYCVFFTNKE